MSDDRQTQQLIATLGALQVKLQKRLGAALSVHGLSLTDYSVLEQLNSAPQQNLRRNDLAERVGLTPSGITRLLNPLEKIGLVEKGSNPRDARVSLVTLSVAGRRVYQEASTAFNAAAQPLFAPLTKAQRSQLTELLVKLL